MNKILITIALLLISTVSIAGETAISHKSLEGLYRSEGYSFVIKEDGVYPYADNKIDLSKKLEYFVENNHVYIRPYFPPGKKPPMDIVVVYKVTKNGLEATHIEDYKTKRRFEEHVAKPVLTKEEYTE